MQTRTSRGAERRPPTIYWIFVNFPLTHSDIHDNILRYICENADSEKYQFNSDIDDISIRREDNFPRPLCIYSHFISDITSANAKVIPFEIGNKTSLKLLFKYCWKERSWKIFLQSPFTPSTTYLYKEIPRMVPPPTANPQSVLSPLLMWP